MQVLIAAPQGAGKTRAAQTLAQGYVNAQSWTQALPDILIIEVAGQIDPTYIAQHVERGGYSVVIFDGCITNDYTLQMARMAHLVASRVAKGPRALMSIFCVQSQSGTV